MKRIERSCSDIFFDSESKKCSCLARKWIRTLLIYFDPQRNTTSGLGLEKEKGGTLCDVLHGEGRAIDQIKETSQKKQPIIQAEVALAANEVELSQKGDYLMLLW